MKYFINILGLSFFLVFISACKTPVATEKKQQTSTIKQSKEFEEAFYAATKARILENFEEAQKLYAECIKINPNSDAALYELSKLRIQTKNFKEALDLIKKAIKIDDSNIWYKITYAEVLSKMGDFAGSADVYEEITKRNPERVDYYYDWANTLLMAQKLNDAIKVYNKIESLIGITEEVSLQKEKIFLNIRKYDAAIDEIKKLSDNSPNDFRYLGMLAELYMATKKTDEAKTIYEKIITVDPNNGMALISLAEYYFQTDKEKSNDYLRKSFACVDLEIDIKMKILLDMYSMSEKDISLKNQAFELAEIMAKSHPDDPKSYSILGDFYYRDKNLNKAKENFEQVIKLDSSKYVVWEQLLIIYSEQNDFANMAEKSKIAMELFPIQPLPCFFNGIANIQLKEYTKAISALNTGKSFVVDNDKLLAEFYSNLGEAYNKTKQYKESDEYYEKSLVKNSNNTFVLNNYSYYLSLRGENLDKALEMAEKATKLSPNEGTFEDTFGWVYYKKGDFENAEKWIKKAMDNGGKNDASVVEHYGDILFKLKKVNEALDMWIKAKSLGEGSEFLNQKIELKKLIE
ncbi:MAG: tetratricopeptide repeat protein [Bacteroidota bacterium]